VYGRYEDLVADPAHTLDVVLSWWLAAGKLSRLQDRITCASNTQGLAHEGGRIFSLARIFSRQCAD
jgi:hypothetical protein